MNNYIPHKSKGVIIYICPWISWTKEIKRQVFLLLVILTLLTCIFTRDFQKLALKLFILDRIFCINLLHKCIIWRSKMYVITGNLILLGLGPQNIKEFNRIPSATANTKMIVADAKLIVQRWKIDINSTSIHPRLCKQTHAAVPYVVTTDVVVCFICTRNL